VHAAEADAWLALGLAAVLNSLPLSAQLATVSGSLWSRVLQVLRNVDHILNSYPVFLRWQLSISCSLQPALVPCSSQCLAPV
jgi:hypothetical protein